MNKLPKCPKCRAGNMKLGKALINKVGGTADFAADGKVVTVSLLPIADLHTVYKCDACGHSFSAGKTKKK